ncbi:hypothetical protein GCM10009765_48980 [Fodinicola feengrottensis]|uniref:histidine kinase n=1 Tax=Fodinicola feengrottensis TaxID=435914 RepID=A0ABP4TU78_9ACTN
MARTAADALPGTRAGDGALAAVVLLLGLIDVAASVDPSLPGLPGLFDGTAAIAAGVVTTSAQAGTVLFRRRWPRRAYALLALVAAVQFVAIGAYPTYAWAVLAFAVARAPGRALGWLAGPLLAAVVAGAALVPIAPGDLLTRAATAVALALTLAVFVLVGALAGRFARAAAGRADWERQHRDQARRTAALTAERARIAEEIGSGVLTGLRRLVEQCERLADAADDDLRRLSAQARAVLAAMRRVLGILRADPESRPVEESADRWRVPLPDRAGLVALAAFVVPAVLLGTLPIPHLGVPSLDHLLALLDLPLRSPLALLAVAVQFAVIGWWRTAPLPALLVWATGALAAGALNATNLVALAGWLVLVCGAASYERVLRSAVVVAITAPVDLAWFPLGGTPSAVLAYVGVVPLWLAGVLIRRHRLQVERDQHERAEARDREAVAQERLRVARDLHDVVAHHVSAVAVQAGAARMAPDPDGRAEALAHIADSVGGSRKRCPS